MTPKEKIKYVADAIDEKIQISPTGPVHLRLYSLTEYEDGPTILSNEEQKSILKKLEEEGRLKNVVFDDDGFGVWLEVISLGSKKQEPPIIRIFYQRARFSYYKYRKTKRKTPRNRKPSRALA